MRDHWPARLLPSPPRSAPGLYRALARLAGVAMVLLSLTLARAQTVPPAEAPSAPPTDFTKPSADASGGQLREVEARPVLRLGGRSTWDEGFASLKGAIEKLAAESRRLGLPVTEKPMAHFMDSDDLGFTYEVFQPLGAEPASGLVPAEGTGFALSPPGRAMVFPHEGAYDEIDSAYEAITAWLDEKGLTATGRFMEEYLFLPEKADDPGMKLNIYIFLK